MKWINKEMPVYWVSQPVSILILLLVTRSFRGVVVPLVTAVGSIVIVYGILGYVGMTIDRYDDDSNASAGICCFRIAYNIHVYSYFKRQFLIHGKRKQAVEETVKEMGWPVLFSALTTFAALLSFPRHTDATYAFYRDSDLFVCDAGILYCHHIDACAP